MRTFAILLAALMLTACSGGPQMSVPSVVPAAQAQTSTPPSYTIHRERGPCPDGCVSMESPGKYLSVRIGPAPTKSASFAYVIPYEMDVYAFDSWTAVGWQSPASGLEGPVELESRLQIQFPDGTWTEFWNEYDQHQDINGNQSRYFPLTQPLHLPAGTTLILYHEQGMSSTSCTTHPSCTDVIWRVYGR